MARANRFRVVLCAFGLLGVMEWTTLSSETIRVLNGPNGQPVLDISVRGVALAILALLAFRSWIHHRRQMLEERSQSGRE